MRRPLGSSARCVGLALCALATSACQTAAPMPDGPALLGTTTDAPLDELEADVASALGRGQVAFGSPDPRPEPTLVLLPPPPAPYEDRSVARPEAYDLRFIGGTCAIVRRTDGEVMPLPGVSCRSAG